LRNINNIQINKIIGEYFILPIALNRMSRRKTFQIQNSILCFQFCKGGRTLSPLYKKLHCRGHARASTDELFDYMPIIDRLKPFRIIRPHLLNARSVSLHSESLCATLLNYAVNAALYNLLE